MKRNDLKLILISVLSMLLLIVAAFAILLFTRVVRELHITAGEEITIDEFRRYSWDQGMFTWVEEPDVTTPGKKEGKIMVFPVSYRVTVHVAPEGTMVGEKNENGKPEEQPLMDTEAPKVVTQTVVVSPKAENFSVSAEQFISSIEDTSPCSVEYETIPDLSHYGKQMVTLVVRDSAGNTTKVEEELYITNVKTHVVSELGAELPKPEEYLVVSGSEVSILTDVSTINVMMEGTYEITLLVDGEETVTTLQIKDTTAPTLVLKKIESWLNKPLETTNFIDFDLTADNSDAFEASYQTEPDWSLLGEQIVTIIATDGAGNSTSETTTLVIKKDEKAPVVSVTDIDVKVGGTVSYKKAVSYYDDIDTKEEMKLSIERSTVNLNEVGTYEVTYTVTDCSGNSTSRTGKINVLEEEPKWEDEEAIHEKAQSILDSILKENMTEREKAKAIYKWIKSHVGYIEHSEKGNYIRGAYEGLFKKQGDCFVYAATAKELLTLAGIPNIDIVKSTTNPSHYWNLVYIEDGWYHFDTTPRYDKSEFFLLTDAELEAYSSAHRNTHIFDRSLYPEIK
ncbi:MAG: hypothetical protein J6K04_05195 [Lachnospiraceae bacterium]|nr:hypothetical protein [Lachnospiraceae bacterium]